MKVFSFMSVVRLVYQILFLFRIATSVTHNTSQEERYLFQKKLCFKKSLDQYETRRLLCISFYTSKTPRMYGKDIYVQPQKHIKLILQKLRVLLYITDKYLYPDVYVINCK